MKTEMQMAEKVIIQMEVRTNTHTHTHKRGEKERWETRWRGLAATRQAAYEGAI